MGAFRYSSIFALGLLLAATKTIAHDGAHGIRRVQEVAWSAPNISRAVTAGYVSSFGLVSFFNRTPTRLETIDGKRCVTTNFIGLDVSNDFAFDVDEEVSLEATFYGPSTGDIYYSYDKNGTVEPVGHLTKPHEGSQWHKVKLRLDRARFADRGMASTDVGFVAEGTYFPGGKTARSTFTLCDLKISRTHTTLPLPAAGKIALTVKVDGQPASARIGIYDVTGRAVIPGTDALQFQYYEKQTRQFKINGSFGPRQYWPHDNRYVFYVDGSYKQALPVGKYSVLVSKGPEYEIARREVIIVENANTAIDISLQRAFNMPAQGWRSGDVHIHLARTKAQNTHLLKFLAAEDVHMSNLLQMNNISRTYFKQHAFGLPGRYSAGAYGIAPGIEGPRTGQRGHTIALNIHEALHNPEDYFLYHRMFEAYQQQGGLTGYAHVGSEEFRASWGLALDAPFGFVDFVEIMQNSRLRPELWYELLNLGFRIAPAAGSDFPYFDQPGAVRNYVKVEGDESIDAWFSGFKAGRTFVTNGPLMNLQAGPYGMGDSVKASPGTSITLKAEVFLNADLGQLQTIDLIRCGDVLETRDASKDNQFDFEVNISEPGWFALKVTGGNHMMAHSAPVYIAGEDGDTGCGDKKYATAELMITRLREMAAHTVDPERELEIWDSAAMKRLYAKQNTDLLKQIDKVIGLYKSQFLLQ